MQGRISSLEANLERISTSVSLFLHVSPPTNSVPIPSTSVPTNIATSSAPLNIPTAKTFSISDNTPAPTEFLSHYNTLSSPHSNFNTYASPNFSTSNIPEDDFLLTGDDVESIIDSLTPSTSSFLTFSLTDPPPALATPNRLHHFPKNSAIHHINQPSQPPSTFSAPPVTPPRSQNHARQFPQLQPGASHYYQSPYKSIFKSPERVMSANQGRDTRSLRVLAVRLARECFFGDDLMARASPSGKGGPGQQLLQLEPQLMHQIREIIQQRARFLSQGEFEALWQKCLLSISKACQNLRYGRLAKKHFRCGRRL